ncbi:transcription factor domain-containing protein [Aspergillus stella-maris]|uniref:transcription factor domain-containing protein n=1 Tax=Aspergillus stella-maris TaxID=1810926 RepID=UPI003CCD4687
MVRNGGNKTYRQVVLPLIFESDLLLKTVLAVAANSLRVQDERFQTIAWRYQNLSLNGLQRSITSPELTWFSRVEALSIVLMLCFFDIYSPAPASMEPHGFPLRPWRAHSLGVRRLLEHKVSPQSQNTHYEQAILSFLGQYFASRCVLTYATVSEGEDSTGLFEDAAHWLGVIDRPPTEIDPFAGCSNQLLGIILSILYEVRSRRISNTSSSDYDDNWVHNTRQELLNIQQHPPADVCHQVARNGVKSCVKATAEAFRFAALILLEALSDPASQSRKAYYISQIFGLVEAGVKIPPCGKLGSSSYLWPYFIVGCHLTCLEQQAAMLQHLDAMTGTGTSQNSPTNVSETTTPMVKQIKDVLMSVWVRATSTSGDLERSFLAHDMDRSWNDRFAWEMVIACGNIMMEWV